MSTKKISDKQREILEYIKHEILQRGYPPAVREICEAVHLKSTSSVQKRLKKTATSAAILRSPGRSRFWMTNLT